MGASLFISRMQLGMHLIAVSPAGCARLCMI
jgi:hypothetical protein